MGKLVLSSAVIALALTAGAGPADEPPGAANVVNAPGTRQFHDGRVRVEVTERADGVRWRVTLTPKGGGSGGHGLVDPPIPAKAPWFVLVASDEVVWVFDGRGEVSVVEARVAPLDGRPVPVVERTDITLPAGWAAMRRKNPPRAFVDRLPAEARPKGVSGGPAGQ